MNEKGGDEEGENNIEERQLNKGCDGKADEGEESKGGGE